MSVPVDEVRSDEDYTSVVLPQLLSPLRYAKVLIQLGYEPLGSKLGHNLLSLLALGAQRPRYPWMGAYIGYMYRSRGLFHLLSTGFAARFFGDCLSEAFQKTAHCRICENIKSVDKEMEDVVEDCSWADFRIVLLQISVSKLTGIIIVYPLKVIMTRQMADFISEETKNEWFPNAAMCIYRENGFFGFYKGFIPCVIGEVAKCSFYFFFCRVLRKALKPRPVQISSSGVIVEPRKDKTLQLICRSITRYLCSNLFYPFEVVSTVMMMDNVRLSNGVTMSEFNSWRVCWRMLKAENQLYRGYSFLFRNHVKPTEG